MGIPIGAWLLLYRKYMSRCDSYRKREQDIEPKVSIKYTFGYLCLPKVCSNYEFMTWCPRAIINKTGRSFSLADAGTGTSVDPLCEAINTEHYKGSIKHNFFD
jgi:hypothetical protein